MFNKYKRAYWAVLSVLSFSTPLLAADKVDLQSQFAVANSQFDIQKLMTAQGDDQYLLPPQAQTGIPQRNVKLRPKQIFKGIEVFGASIVVKVDDNGQYSDPIGFHYANIGDDITNATPTLSLEEAKRKALKHGGKGLSENDVYNVETKLNVWLDANYKAHLAWFVSYVDVSNKPSRPHFFIDAHTGEILQSWDGMAFAEGTGPGGNERTGRYEYGPGGTYPAFEVTGSGSNCKLDSPNVVTYDMNHQRFGGTIHSFPCYENTERQVNGSYSALNDAHAFGQVTFDMFKDWYGQSPLTQKLKLRVHYDREFENAFWDGQQMTFGDGKNTFHPLVGLGVVAHEVSHGFTQQNSNLRYENQSGGLNESFSDIAAAAASYYLTGTFSWQIGDKIKKHSGAMRYMDDPTRDGRSIGHTRDYTPGMNVHYSSGVYNKAFYLLANKRDWNIRKAFDVYVKANQLYWNANETFDSAGRGVYNAAKDLGYCLKDVVDSLTVVGVASPGNADGCDIDDDLPVADFTHSANKLVVSFKDTSRDKTGVVNWSWSFGDGKTSTEQNPTHTYASKGSYQVSLTVEDGDRNSDTKQATVTVDDDVVDPCGEAWDVEKSYAIGDRVTYSGRKYEATWWSTGARPDIFSNVWKDLGKCSGGGNQAPSAGFSVSTSMLVASFTDNSTDDKGVVSYSWRFGDGKTSTQQNPSHEYAAKGTYEVSLTVKDAEGETDSITKQVTVSDDDVTCNAPAWDASTVYVGGDEVSHLGNEYRAKWWNQNQSPETNSGPWDVWELLPACQ